ncbi:rhodanese-like domain-containing protein [Rurimicrobium arvi]|uniref:Rhodanese domain-containing protein n=1 Tax=Rurimicrobium arvi TaxID=2049916 RepID=A0ABP8N187_9BACT
MNKQVMVIDVRTREEFAGGHVAGSINIPLGELAGELTAIRDMAQPLILCCASGGRSGQAAAFLKANGIDCTNGGSWLQVNALSRAWQS